MKGLAVEFGWRLGVVLLAGLGLLFVRLAALAWSAHRRRQGLRSEPAPALAGDEPTVLLFSGRLCGDCEQQKQVLLDLRRDLGNAWRIREVQAAGEVELARRFGVESIPATVILDAAGRPLAVNYGLVPASTLQGQLKPALRGRVPVPG